jgi:hypothetical protein
LILQAEKINGQGDMMFVENEMSHTIIAAKGRYKHLAIQLPSTFQYGFDFKRTLDFPGILQRIVQSEELARILSSTAKGVYLLEQADVAAIPTIITLKKSSASLLSSL